MGSDCISYYDLHGKVKLNVRKLKKDDFKIELQKHNLDTEEKNQLQVRLQQALQAHIDEHDGNTVIDVQKPTAVIAPCKDGNSSFLYYTEQQTKQIYCARLIYTGVTDNGDHLHSVDYPQGVPSVRSISVIENCVAISATGNRKGVHIYTKLTCCILTMLFQVWQLVVLASRVRIKLSTLIFYWIW